jgi:hypothetical protein
MCVVGVFLASSACSLPTQTEAPQAPVAYQADAKQTPAETAPSMATDPDPSAPLRAEGISVIPPSGNDWFEDTSIVQWQPPGPLRLIVLFRKRAQPPHSVVASVSRKELAADISSRLRSATEREKLLYQLRDQNRSEWDSGRSKAISFAASIDHSLGYDCLKVDALGEDRGVPGHAGEVFEFEQHAYHCIAPDLRSVVIVEYSQRAPKGAARYDLRSEGEPFLKSLHFAAAGEPPGPTRSLNDRIAFMLDDYARRLRESGNPTKANEVAGQAQQLREYEQQKRAGTASIYMPFVPDKVLQEYAGFLRAKGLPSEAAEADALAKEYRDNQIRAFMELMRRSRGQPPK